VNYTCFNCLDGIHRKCESRHDCACSICKIAKPKVRKRYKPKNKRVYESVATGGVPGTKPWTEEEKDEIANNILKMYQGFVDKGYYTPRPEGPVKDHKGAVSQEEGDEICLMVVQLLEHIKRKQNEHANS
jgi:hypothetical protein